MLIQKVRGYNMKNELTDVVLVLVGAAIACGIIIALDALKQLI